MRGTMGFKNTNQNKTGTRRQQTGLQTVNVTCVVNHAGIITVVTPTGEVECYRQRGIGKLTRIQMQNLIATGRLDRQVVALSDLPKNYNCKFEPGSKMGRCIVNFNKQKYGLQ